MSVDLPDSKISATIEECCAWAVPVTLLLCDDQIAACGCFDSISPSSLRLAVFAVGRPDESHPPELRPGQRCVVTFVYRSRTHFFVVPIIDTNPAPDEPTIQLLDVHVPRQIPAAEVRQTLRVPVIGDGSITAEATVFGKLLRPGLKNLSLTGALLEFDDDADPKLATGDQLEVTLSQGRRSTHLRALVRQRSVEMVRARADLPWQKKARYGILFSEIHVGPTTPPGELHAMIAELRKRWLKSGLSIVPGA